MDWLHTLNREWLERIANDLLKEMAMTILDPDRSRIVSIDFVDNPTTGRTPMRAANSVGWLLKTVQQRVTATAQHTSFQTGSR